MPELSDKQRWEREKRQEKWLDERGRARARDIVELWNTRLRAREEPYFMPTIRAALLANRPWLMIDCHSCRLMIDMDLRVKPRPQHATVLMAIADIKCPRCNGHGRPFIEGLAQGPR